jgi:hypothetical protein
MHCLKAGRHPEGKASIGLGRTRVQQTRWWERGGERADGRARRWEPRLHKAVRAGSWVSEGTSTFRVLCNHNNLKVLSVFTEIISLIPLSPSACRVSKPWQAQLSEEEDRVAVRLCALTEITVPAKPVRGPCHILPSHNHPGLHLVARDREPGSKRAECCHCGSVTQAWLDPAVR